MFVEKNMKRFHGEELRISTRGRYIRGVLSTLNILSSCGCDLITLVLRQGRDQWVGKAEGEEVMDINDVCIIQVHCVLS